MIKNYTPVLIFLLSFFSGLGSWVFSQDVIMPGSASCGAGAVSGTWTVPCDVASITVEVYAGGGGAGGGGGGSNGGFYNTRGGGGGGGGGYTSITINVVPGSAFSYSIGSGGCGGSNGSDASDGGSGSAGGNSTFTGTALGGTPVNLSANGGSSGGGGDGTEGSPGSGGSGGNSSGGTSNLNGTAGSSGSGGNGGNGGAGAGPAGGAGGVGNTASGDIYGGGGAGGGNSPGGVGAAGGILITFTATTVMPEPVISSTAPTCTTAGASVISNYNSSMTYIFSPAGPSAGSGGTISGMITGTTYTVIASDGICSSAPSTPFSNSSAGVPPPTITTSAPTCTSGGISTITNYNAGLTYLFSPAGPSAGSGGVISGMIAGTTYTVVANDSACSSLSSSSFSNAAQFPTPVVSISSSDADSTVCSGDNVVFTASPSGIADYNFLLNGISAQGGPSNSFATSTLTNGDILSVIPTSSDGCPGNSANSITFTVNPIPSVSLVATDDSICPGTNVVFTASPPGNDSYEFFNGPASVQDSSASSFSISSLVNGNNISVVTTDLGCSSPASNTLSVYVYPAPSITLSSTDADSSVCAGDTVTFTASPSGYNTYLFSVNGTQVQNSSSNTFVSGSVADNDVISAIALDFGCPSIPSSIGFSVSPFATANAGNDAIICAGSTHTLSGTIGGSATSNSWTTSGNGTFDNAALANATYTPSSADTAAGSVFLTITTNDPDGSGPCPSVNDAVLLTLNPLATASAGNDATICADTTLFLNGAIGGSATANTWTTSGSGSFDNSSLITATYSPSPADISAGNVTLTITTDDPDGGGPCTTVSDAMTLSINPLPAETISSSQNTICAGQTVTFTASPPGMNNYNFFINGVSVQSGSGSTYTSTNITGNDTLSVVITNLGCSGLGSNPVNITVNPIPNVSLSASPSSVCQGDSVIFLASSSTAGSNYQFMNGFVELQNGPDSILVTTALPPGNGVVVIATSLGCSSPPSNIVSVSVNAQPNADAGQSVSLCAGFSTTLTASGGINYLWNNGVNTSANTVSPTSATTWYYVTVTDANNCEATDSVSVSLNQPSQVAVNGNNVSCNQQGTQITASGGNTYQWSPSAGLSSTTISNPIANPDTATTYQVVSTDLNGCTDTSSITIIPSSVSVNAGTDFSISYGSSVGLNPSGAQSYTWDPPEGLSCTSCSNPVATPTATTNYIVTGTDEYGCTSTDDVTIEVIINTEIFVPDAFSPNGDGENDKLFVRGSAISELYFAVFDRWGEKVFETKDDKQGWDGTINGRNSDAAVYVYVLYAKMVNGFEVKKKGDITLMR